MKIRTSGSTEKSNGIGCPVSFSFLFFSIFQRYLSICSCSMNANPGAAFHFCNAHIICSEFQNSLCREIKFQVSIIVIITCISMI